MLTRCPRGWDNDNHRAYLWNSPSKWSLRRITFSSGFREDPSLRLVCDAAADEEAFLSALLLPGPLEGFLVLSLTSDPRDEEGGVRLEVEGVEGFFLWLE